MSAVGALGIISVIAALVTWAVLSMVAKDTGTRSATALSTTAASSGQASSVTSAPTAQTSRPTTSSTVSSASGPATTALPHSITTTTNRTEGPGAVTGISLTCVRSSDKVVATLTFDSPTDIISMVRAGENRSVTNHSAGHITTTAETSDLQATCLGVVGSRSVGPIPAT